MVTPFGLTASREAGVTKSRQPSVLGCLKLPQATGQERKTDDVRAVVTKQAGSPGDGKRAQVEP